MFLTPFIFGEYCVRYLLRCAQKVQQISKGNLPSTPRVSSPIAFGYKKGRCAPLFIFGECGIRTHAPLPANGFQGVGTQ